MKFIKTFGEQLSELLASHSINASALATELGMSNVTGVFRLLRNQASDKKQRELIVALRERGAPFDEAEIDRLEGCVDVNRLGKRAYKTQKSIEELIFQAPRELPETMMAEGMTTLTSFIAKLPEREPLQILCTNCVESGAIGAIEALLRDPQRVIEVTHYVCINEDTRNPALLVNNASRLMLDSRYRLYVATENENGSDALLFTPCMMYVKVGVGHRAEEMALFIGSDHVARHARPPRSAGMFDFVRECIASVRPEPKQLRMPSRNAGDLTMMDLFFSAYQMEKRRAYYQIKPDLCSGTFPPDVFVSAITESPDAPDDVKAQFSERLPPILTARYQNEIEKQQPTYFVCSPTETAAFFRTGVLSDQPAGMRPFTPEERRRIADEIIGRATDNPRYHFRFLWEDLRIGRFQFIGYEGLGVLCIKRDTDYDLRDNTGSFLISEPMFLRQYIDYFLETLLPRHTYSESESVAQLVRMRDEILS